MVYLKGCPRCHGDLFPEGSGRDRAISCLQCGHVLSQSEELALSFRSPGWVRVSVPPPRRAT